MHIEIEEKMTILFQGDSITDCDRDRTTNDMGKGYVFMAASQLSAQYPEERLTILNRGIGGDTSWNLTERWQSDCLALKPHILSILIGINNAYYDFENSVDIGKSVAKFESEYNSILSSVAKKLHSQLILCEPFLVPVDTRYTEIRRYLDPMIGVVRAMARQYKALLIPFDGIFQAACSHAEPEYWCHDGVHPTGAGHALMATEWMNYVLA